MKLKKIIFPIVAVLLLCLTAFFTLADTAPSYKGTVAEAEAMLLEIDAETNLARMRKKLDAVAEYIAGVDPASAGYNEFMAKLDNKELEIIYAVLASISEKTAAASKATAFADLAAFAAAHPFGEGAAANYKGTPITVASYLALLSAEKQSAVTAFITEAGAALNTDARHALLDGLVAFCADNSFTLTEGDAAAVIAMNFLTAEEYLASVPAESLTDDAKYAELGAVLRLLSTFEKKHAFPTEGEALAAYRADLSAKAELFMAKRLASIAALDKMTHLYDYNDDAPFDLDFDDADVGTLKDEGNSSVDGVYKTRIGIETGADGNKYYTVHYDKAEAFATTLDLTSIEHSLVFEFDITTHSALPKAEITCTDKANSGVTAWDVTYFRILPNGDIASGIADTEVLVPHGVTAGEWTHISMVLDLQDNILKLYVDYQLVEERSVSKDGYYYAPDFLKLGAAPSGSSKSGGEFSIDNVRAYSGYAPRDIRASAGLTDIDRLALYTERFNEASLVSAARLEFYEAAKSLSSTLKTNPDAAAALASFGAISGETVLAVEKSAKDANRDKYISYVNTLTGLAKGEATNVKRNYWLSRTESFLSGLSGKYTDDALFNQARETFSSIRSELDYERVAAEFTEHVTAFYTSSDVEEQKAKRVLAIEVYAFLNLEYLSDADAFPEFTEALLKYSSMDATLEENVKIENSKKLYSLLYYVGKYKTEAEWAANYEFLKNYVSLARSIINEGNFDEYYNDINEMMPEFSVMNAYFFARMQTEHLAYLKGEMARFGAASEFFEKYGIAVMIKRYAAENEVDTANAEIAALLLENEANLKALEAEIGSYDELLRKNAELFAEKCKTLIGAIDYLTMKRIVGEASVYFYSMNVNDAGVQDALAIYISRRNEILTTEAYAGEFIAATAAISAAETDEEKLAAIVEAGQYTDKVETAVAGVDTALAALNAEIEAYNASVKNNNEEIAVAAKTAAHLANLGERDSMLTAILERLFGWKK